MKKRFHPSQVIRSGGKVVFRKPIRRVMHVTWVQPRDGGDPRTLRLTRRHLPRRVKGRVNHGTRPVSEWWSVLRGFSRDHRLWESVRRHRGETAHAVRHMPRHQRLHRAMRAGWQGYIGDIDEAPHVGRGPRVAGFHQTGMRLFARYGILAGNRRA